MNDHCDQKVNLDERLECEMQKHLSRYVKQYDELSKEEKDKLDLLEYRMDNTDPESNRIIDRALLAGYLSLKVAKSNNAIQKRVAVFAGTSIVAGASMIIIEVLRAYGRIP